jgi:hypothetical protein
MPAASLDGLFLGWTRAKQVAEAFASFGNIVAALAGASSIRFASCRFIKSLHLCYNRKLPA